VNQASQNKKPHFSQTQAGVIQHPLLVGLLLLAVVYGAFQLVASHVSAESSTIKSAIAGYCLDVHDDSKSSNAAVDSWRCNGSSAQNWKLAGSSIIHGDNDCLSVLSNSTAAGTKLVANSCDQAAGQVWLADRTGFENPNSGLCLSIPSSKLASQLVLASCDQLSTAGESWTYSATHGHPADVNSCETIVQKGQKIACYAQQDWTTWQSDSPSHTVLLNDYTNGYGYEEWCADFVSYVYMQAGYPFSGGESDGWDENIASNIQNMGFSEHQAAGYTPKAGDVAFFDYPGGHVEIVASGGKTPTFIYGNSSTIDPTTGNGEMAANTITNDYNGQVIYYLSPN
jgi:hypothetical protein